MSAQQRNNATVRSKAIRVSEAWHKWLKIAAAEEGIDVAEMAERCFLMFRGPKGAR